MTDYELLMIVFTVVGILVTLIIAYIKKWQLFFTEILVTVFSGFLLILIYHENLKKSIVYLPLSFGKVFY